MASRVIEKSMSKYEVLREVVKDYPGILSGTDSLLQELTAEDRNWEIVVHGLRTYAVKNFYIHDHHEKGIDAIKTTVDLFLNAIEFADQPVQRLAADSLLFYLEKILVEGSHNLDRYMPVLQDCFTSLNRLDEKRFLLFVTNPHQLKKLGQIIFEKMSGDFDIEEFSKLLVRFFSATYRYLLAEEDLIRRLKRTAGDILNEHEFKNIEDALYPVSHENLKALLKHLDLIAETADKISLLRELLKLPGYMQMVKFYEDLVVSMPGTSDPRKELAIRTAYLTMVLKTKGLFSIHENALRETRRTISRIVKAEEPEYIKTILTKIFDVFQKSIRKYPETVLSCIQGIGNDIYSKGNSQFVEWFIHRIISLDFQYPEIQGATDEWQVKANRAHLKNIRVWLELIENNPKWSKSLISALIINLKLAGVHINDTDLFQKDITKLLNSDIKPVYHAIKQLAKLFPVYFNEIGAEGELRDVSTEIDESTGRADILIHFLRKQSHVESSARVVDFIEEIIRFWLTRDKTPLRQFLPEELYERISTSGIYIDELNIVFKFIFTDIGIRNVGDLLKLKEEDILKLLDKVPRVSAREKKRAFLSIRFYQLLNKKYELNPQDIKNQLQYAQSLGLPGADTLISSLEKVNTCERLDAILNYMNLLKDIVLSPETFEPVENVFRKRHIAAGIASVYGVYHERKFDAIGLILRLENLSNILFEELVNSFNLKFITRATLFEIIKFANLFHKALHLDGISSNRLENTLELLTVALEVRRFSFSQYIDIFRGFSEAVQDILNTYYSDFFKNNLKQIIQQMGNENLLPKYLDTSQNQNDFEMVNTVSELFLRETVANSFALQQLDTFISRILKTLFEQAEGLDSGNLDLLMSYDPKKSLSNIYNPNSTTNDRIHLGNKGYNLIKMASLGVPVPPGFIITTEVFRCEKAINKFRYAGEHLEEEIKDEIAKLEKITGQKFGNPENPLIVSVRSGGAISMPGMMISFLNVGINESIVNGLIRQTGKPWFAWDCYRRFLQCWGMSFGMERDNFDEIMNFYKNRYKVPRKIMFAPDQMKELAYAYRETVKETGIEITDDPKTQLNISIAQVFKSWFSKKAQTYRELMGISEHWGTAVIVQKMVYGNLDTNSGTGVLFTRNPQDAGDRVTLWGDFAIGAQGEDIVLGLVKTLPISNEQKPIEDRSFETSFEDSFPELYDELLRITNDLIYKLRWGAQEIEFTFEGETRDNLFILQSRDMSIPRKESFIAFVPSRKLNSQYLSRGIGVGGGALSGRVVFDLDEIKDFREKDPSVPLILIRSDTVPDDIRYISAADGLLTSRGGPTSHAAIIANRLGKTCVVGCNNLIVWEQEKRCKINKRVIKAGEFLSIDGRNGAVYSGKHRVETVKAGIS